MGLKKICSPCTVNTTYFFPAPEDGRNTERFNSFLRISPMQSLNSRKLRLQKAFTLAIMQSIVQTLKAFPEHYNKKNN